MFDLDLASKVEYHSTFYRNSVKSITSYTMYQLCLQYKLHMHHYTPTRVFGVVYFQVKKAGWDLVFSEEAMFPGNTYEGDVEDATSL